MDPDASQRQDVSDEHPETAKRLKRVVDNAGLKAHCHEVRLYTSSGPELDVALHCDFPPSMPMAEIHRNTEMIEQVVRRAFPNLEQVVVQAEPRVRLLAADG
ncbi:MAG: cation transporter dimerization domain-containing protein [Chloroflexia bacterium]